MFTQLYRCTFVIIGYMPIFVATLYKISKYSLYYDFIRNGVAVKYVFTFLNSAVWPPSCCSNHRIGLGLANIVNHYHELGVLKCRTVCQSVLSPRICIRMTSVQESESAVKSNEHSLSGDEEEKGNEADKGGKKGSTLDSWVKKSEKEPKTKGKRSRKEDDGDKGSENKKSKTLTPVEESMADFDFNACEKTTPDGKSWNFKISSWNVAGLRAWVKKGGHHYIPKEQPDIITLQETKCPENKLPAEVQIDGYYKYWLGSEKDGYAGVALYSKQKPLEVKYGIGDKALDKEGRLITAEYEKFYLVATYVVNAGQGLKTLDRKLEWNKLFESYLKELDAKKPVILTGDLNVAHKEIDLKNPKTNQKSAGFTPEEREDMTKLLSQGFVDTFRHFNPEKEGAYTFWTYMSNARAKNTGWRLDYFVVSERLLPNVCDSVIRDKVLGSDHCPITLFMHI